MPDHQTHVVIHPVQPGHHGLHVADNAVQVLVQHPNVVEIEDREHDQQDGNHRDHRVGDAEMMLALVESDLGFTPDAGHHLDDGAAGIEFRRWHVHGATTCQGKGNMRLSVRAGLDRRRISRPMTATSPFMPWMVPAMPAISSLTAANSLCTPATSPRMCCM